LGTPVNILDRYIGFSDNNGAGTLVDYIDASATFQTVNDFDVEFYFQHFEQGTPVALEGFLANGNSSAPDDERRLLLLRDGTSANSDLRFYNTSNGYETIALSGFCENGVLNKWRLVKTGSSVEVFKNDVSQSVTDVTGYETSDADTTRWLALDYTSSRSASGAMWDISVTENGSLLYSWGLDEGSGAQATDSSGNDNHGLITDGSPVTFWGYYLPRGMAPKTGPIYNGPLLIGERDPVTKVFTPDAGTPTAELISDQYQIGNACVTVPAGQDIPSIGGDFTEDFNDDFY
jgi:hypothetical protein